MAVEMVQSGLKADINLAGVVAGVACSFKMQMKCTYGDFYLKPKLVSVKFEHRPWTEVSRAGNSLDTVDFMLPVGTVLVQIDKASDFQCLIRYNGKTYWTQSALIEDMQNLKLDHLLKLLYE